jgi:hypothetical protein
MKAAHGYEYVATLPADDFPEGPYAWTVTAFRGGQPVTFPGGAPQRPTAWNFAEGDSWTLDIAGPGTPLRLFDAASDADSLSFTRIGDAGRRGRFRIGLSGATRRPVLRYALPVEANGRGLPDYTASLVIKGRIDARREHLPRANAVKLRLRGLGPRQTLHVTLMEDDGTSWSVAAPVDSLWREISIPLSSFAAARGVLLPEGFPGEWNYWVGPAEGRAGAGDRPRLEHLERLQLSLRGSDDQPVEPDRYGVEIEWATLVVGAADATTR